MRTLIKKMRETLYLTLETEKETMMRNRSIYREMLGEVSSVFMTISGKYDQDPYGAIWKDEVLPGLIAALNEYRSEKNLGLTHLMREINRVSDVLDFVSTCTLATKQSLN